MTTISKDELKSLIDSKGEYILVDVREEEELQFGMIESAIHIPVKKLRDAFDHPSDFGISKETPVIFYCRTGHRSALATNFARRKGFKAKNYRGSIKEWAKIDKTIEVY